MTESTRSASSPVLEVDGLRTEFRLRNSTVGAVDDVSFQVLPGECVGLVGESGCGKSTTGLSIMKLLPPIGHVTSGSIRLDGRDLVPLDDGEMRELRGNEVSMIFQDPMTSLNPTWRIGRQIAESVRLHRGASSRRRWSGRSRSSAWSACRDRRSVSTSTPTSFREGCASG